MTSSPSTDSEGYRLCATEFKSGGYFYKFVEKLDEEWYIYSVYSPNCEKIIDYELVRLTKSEEFVIAGNVISKKWCYPTANAFGKNGFSCHCLAGCYRKYKEVLKRESERGQDGKFVIPRNKEFTAKELAAELGVSRYEIDKKIKSLGESVKIVSSIKNKMGKDTKVLMYV